jgi:hypothetical protein
MRSSVAAGALAVGRLMLMDYDRHIIMLGERG